jgi:Uma2 family endonuclease
MRRVLVKIADYLVGCVWLIDPRKRTATVYTAHEVLPVSGGILRTATPDIAVPLAELF